MRQTTGDDKPNPKPKGPNSSITGRISYMFFLSSIVLVQISFFLFFHKCDIHLLKIPIVFAIHPCVKKFIKGDNTLFAKSILKTAALRKEYLSNMRL